MSDLDLKKDWKKWYPEEIFLNNSANNYNVLWNRSFLKETDFYTVKKNENKYKQSNEPKKISLNNDKSYCLNIKKNLKEKKQKYIALNNTLQDLCLHLESEISLFEKTLSSRLLKTILIVSSYIVGETILINESVLLKKVNKIIKNNNFFLKKPQLVIHPSNKKILEKILKKSIDNKLELVCNKSIDINSFKILSEQSNIDATIYARWKAVYRVFLEEEEH
ncbi:MAG: flagellar assembly protein FliH [Buchnera aphidicola (Aphis urticata)]|uniref:Flagellar assembly protein FliH n=1 Tax=Buchnera aphidicola (Aphis urticata) TaxID=2708353 RepID=A0AAJ4GB93_9GAMM|nr:MAG: flagellar assembly protein FliH [Buchnera aphidicola (Aphis urticata)]